MSRQFKVEPSFWALFPETEIAFLTIHGVDNHDHGQVPEGLLVLANEEAEKWVENDPISANPVIKDWREAYTKFKTKKGARCAVENLLKRAKNGKGVGSINPVVDIYNSVSLDWAFPLAAEDMHTLQGDIRLTVAQGGEPFYPIGEDEMEEALPGEVIYEDDQDVISRCWAWRDSARVEATEASTDLVFYMENVNPERKADHEQAIATLQERLQKYLGVTATVDLVTKDHPVADFD